MNNIETFLGCYKKNFLLSCIPKELIKIICVYAMHNIISKIDIFPITKEYGKIQKICQINSKEVIMIARNDSVGRSYILLFNYKTKKSKILSKINQTQTVYPDNNTNGSLRIAVKQYKIEQINLYRSSDKIYFVAYGGIIRCPYHRIMRIGFFDVNNGQGIKWTYNDLRKSIFPHFHHHSAFKVKDQFYFKLILGDVSTFYKLVMINKNSNQLLLKEYCGNIVFDHISQYCITAKPQLESFNLPNQEYYNHYPWTSDYKFGKIVFKRRDSLVVINYNLHTLIKNILK